MNYNKIARDAAKKAWGIKFLEFLPMYLEEAKRLKKFMYQGRLKSLAKIVYKESHYGKNFSLYLSLTHSLSVLKSKDFKSNTPIKIFRENKQNTGKICGCIEGCCSYCYPGA